MSKNSTTNTAIGIPREIYEKIKFQALAEYRTISGIISDFLRNYLSCNQLICDIGFVFLQEPIAQKIFERYLDRVLVKGAKPSYYTGMRDIISFIHGKNDVKSVANVKLWFSTSNFTNKAIQADLIVEFSGAEKPDDFVFEKETDTIFNVPKFWDANHEGLLSVK